MYCRARKLYPQSLFPMSTMMIAVELGGLLSWAIQGIGNKTPSWSTDVFNSVVCLLALVSGWNGYLPVNWSAEHAESDPERSDCILIARVVTLRQSGQAVVTETGVDGESFQSTHRNYSCSDRTANFKKRRTAIITFARYAI